MGPWSLELWIRENYKTENKFLCENKIWVHICSGRKMDRMARLLNLQACDKTHTLIGQHFRDGLKCPSTEMKWNEIDSQVWEATRLMGILKFYDPQIPNNERIRVMCETSYVASEQTLIKFHSHGPSISSIEM